MKKIDSTQPDSKKSNYNLAWVVLLAIVICFLTGGIVYYLQERKVELIEKKLEAQIKELNEKSEYEKDNRNQELSDKYSDWEVYKNQEYGFEFKYPKKYEIKMDEYGYPNGIVLLKEDFAHDYTYVVEAWEAKNGFEKKHNRKPYFQVKKGANYITFDGGGKEREEIISTFK